MRVTMRSLLSELSEPADIDRALAHWQCVRDLLKREWQRLPVSSRPAAEWSRSLTACLAAGEPVGLVRAVRDLLEAHEALQLALGMPLVLSAADAFAAAQRGGFDE